MERSCILVCHVLGYAMYLVMSCIWICHVFRHVMYFGMPCIWVCHVFGYQFSLFPQFALLDFENVSTMRYCFILFDLEVILWKCGCEWSIARIRNIFKKPGHLKIVEKLKCISMRVIPISKSLLFLPKGDRISALLIWRETTNSCQQTWLVCKNMPYEWKLIAASNHNVMFRLLQISSQFQLYGKKTTSCCIRLQCFCFQNKFLF